MAMTARVRAMLGSGPDSERGAVAVLVAILATLLVGMSAFAVDLGIAYASKRELSVASDAAALAAAREAAIEYQRSFPGGRACDTAVIDAISPAAEAAAADVYRAQLPGGSDGDPSVELRCDGADGFLVEASSSATHDVVFAAVFGEESMNPTGSATAKVSGSQSYYGLRPYAVCVDQFESGRIYPDATQQSLYSFQKGLVGCGGLPPGNWGLVDFDGGSNPTGDIASWTRFGYPGAVQLPDPNMPGDPGANFNATSVRAALDSLVGPQPPSNQVPVVTFPVATRWQEEGGNNATFNATTAVSVEVCGYQIGKSKKTTTSCWNQQLANSAPKDVDLIIQWRFKATATSYTGTTAGTDCPLSSGRCVPAVRLWE
jgi:Flp pilus assembly protein TadG